jgi:hypothetical protein
VRVNSFDCTLVCLDGMFLFCILICICMHPLSLLLHVRRSGVGLSH